MAIIILIKAVLIEAHQSIRLVKRAYLALQRAYQIIINKYKDIYKELVLQIAVKAINDTASLNRLIPTLLVYRAYLRISNLDPSALSIIDRAVIIQKTMAEIIKLQAK